MHLKLITRKVVHVGSESISEDAALKIGMRFSESLDDDYLQYKFNKVG